MHDDPLIAYGWQNLIQVTLLLLIGVIGVTGFISRKLEGALFFSILGGGSIILLVLTFFVNSRIHVF